MRGQVNVKEHNLIIFQACFLLMRQFILLFRQKIYLKTHLFCPEWEWGIAVKKSQL